MKITRQTMKADGITVGEALDLDAAFLRSIGFPAKAGSLTLDEQRDKLKEAFRHVVLCALDIVMSELGKPEKGWKDADLPNLFRAVDGHAAAVFDREMI